MALSIKNEESHLPARRPVGFSLFSLFSPFSLFSLFSTFSLFSLFCLFGRGKLVFVVVWKNSCFSDDGKGRYMAVLFKNAVFSNFSP